MKFLCLAYYDPEKFEALPKAEVEAIVGQCPAYDRKLRDTGRLVVSASLGLPQGTRTLRPRGGHPSTTDGPYAETKEQVGGFFIIDAGDMNEAVQIASNHPAAHLGEQIGWAVEVRPIEFFEQLTP